MPAYILRMKRTKRLFGFYAAEDEGELFCLVDEDTDPFDYEFAAIGWGYGIQFRKGGWPVKYKIGSGEKALYRALSGADNIYFTESLALALGLPVQLLWRQFPTDLPTRLFRKS